MNNKEVFIVWISVIISLVLSDILKVEPVLLIIFDVAIVSAVQAFVKKFRRKKEKKPVERKAPVKKSVDRDKWGGRLSKTIRILIIAILFILYGVLCAYTVSIGELTVSFVVSSMLILGTICLILTLFIGKYEKKIMERGDKRDWVVAQSETVRTLVKTRKEEQWEKNSPSNRKFVFGAIGFILFVYSDVYLNRKGIETSPLYLLVFFVIEYVMSKLEELTRKKK